MKTRGNWVIKASDPSGYCYWCGNAHFDPALRKAQVYVWKEKAEEQIEVIKTKNYFPGVGITFEVIEIVPPQIRKDTEAEWIPHYEEVRGIVYISYTCSCCGNSALNDYRGNSVASRFCPSCSRRMINSTMED